MEDLLQQTIESAATESALVPSTTADGKVRVFHIVQHQREKGSC